MEANDPSSSECLRILLEEQARGLRLVAQRLNALCTACSQSTQPTQWTGFARNAHNLVAQRIRSQLVTASVAVDDAADHSMRAVSALASRVG